MSDIAFRFTSATNDQITDLERFEDGRWKAVKTKPFESYRFEGNELIRTISKRGKVRSETFVEVPGSGIYTATPTDKVTGQSTGKTRNGRGADSADTSTVRKNRKALVSNSSIDGLTGIAGADPTTPISPNPWSDNWGDDDDDDDDDAGYGGYSSRGNDSRDDDTMGYGNDDDDDDDGGNDLHRIVKDTNNNILQVLEYDDGGWEPESIDPNESWTLNKEGQLIKSELYRFGTEVTTYAPLPNLTDTFTKVSEVFLPASASTPSPLTPNTIV